MTLNINIIQTQHHIIVKTLKMQTSTDTTPTVKKKNQKKDDTYATHTYHRIIIIIIIHTYAHMAIATCQLLSLNK